MPKGGASTSKVHFKGENEDYIVFIDDQDSLKKYKEGDKSVPLADVVQSFKIFVTHKHGAQGTYDGASNATLDNEFGTHEPEEVIKKILEKGTLQESEFQERSGSKNDSKGTLIGH